MPTLLDVGCGTGLNVKELSTVAQASGLDASADAVRYSKRRGLKTVHQGLSQRTGLKAQSIEIVTMLDVLEHVPETASLKEMRRILKSDGLLIITVPAFMWLWSEWDVVLHHRCRYTKHSLQRAVEAQGFEVEKISYLYSFLVLPVWLIRRVKSLFRQQEYQSDFKLSHPFVNWVMERVAAAERRLMWVWSLPLGTSVVLVARKKG